MISGTTRLYGIVGDPVAHVRVPAVFNARFAAQGIDAVCVPLHLPAAHLAAGIAGLKAIENVDGFVVTAPHKHAMVALCDVVADGARLAGAVNAVRREAGGRLVGDLFDGRGFVEGLRAHGHDPRGRRVFIAGAGGAGTALAFALAAAGARALTIHNRTAARAEALAQRVQTAYPGCEARSGSADPRGHDIAANATALGLQPGDPLSFDPSALTASTVVAEVIMKPEKTALLAAAEQRGCPIHLGRHMLDYQVDLIFDHIAGTRGGAA